MATYIEENDLTDQYGAWGEHEAYPREDWVYEGVRGGRRMKRIIVLVEEDTAADHNDADFVAVVGDYISPEDAEHNFNRLLQFLEFWEVER